jgi:hypothetical protein
MGLGFFFLSHPAARSGAPANGSPDSKRPALCSRKRRPPSSPKEGLSDEYHSV